MQTVEGILAEIDDLVASSRTAAAHTKVASAGNSADGVTELIEKLAHAADVLDSGASLTNLYTGAFSSDPNKTSTEQRVLDKLAEARALSGAMHMVNLVDEALAFSKTASARGYDELEAFKFFYQQQLQQQLKGNGA